MRIKFYALLFVGLSLVSLKSFAQTYSGTWGTMTEKPNTPINEMINGYIEVLPPGYNPAGSTLYPLLIFFEGQSQFGNGSSTELQNLYGLNEGMLPDIVRKGLLPNDQYKFIIIIPQLRPQVQTYRSSAEQMASPSEVNDVINYALQNYRADVNRVYLSGLSLGGGSTWNYAGESTAYANRLAAIVPFAGASNVNDKPSRADVIAQANLPVWTFVTSTDDIYEPLAQAYINAIIASPYHNTSTDALITIYSRGAFDHNSWQQPLQGGNTLEGGNTGSTSYPSNIYNWILSKTRTGLQQPVFATVNAGSDIVLDLANGSMVLGTDSVSFNGATAHLSGSVTAAPGHTTTNVQWLKVNGTGGTIVNPNSLETDVTGLMPGNYTYQLKATDDQGLISVNNVFVTVNKPTENKYYRVEAEDYNSVSGPLIQKGFIDEGPAYGLGFLSTGNSMSYNVNVASAGTYDLYYRYNTYAAQPIQIVVNGTTYSASLSGVNAPNWVTSKISVPLASSNVIEFISQGNNWQGFNYFELAQTSSISLPVKFVYFNAQCNGSSVNLQWKTAQEQNTKDFSIQRTTDGTSWTEIGKTAAAGQSAGERTYAFVDKAPLPNSMYRIVETDATGQQTISTIVRSSCSSARNVITLYPNPSAGNSALNVTLDQATSITMQVLDVKGAVMMERQMQLPQGSTTVPVNLTNYPNGVYTIALRMNGETRTLKMIKK